MKTLYEVLEVSENASKEVIEKAYRVLAKKYHPDLQTSENKVMAEGKIKEINGAYEVLSDDVKRKSYDEQLIKIREEKRQSELQDYQRNMQSDFQNDPINSQGNMQNQSNEIRRQYEKELRRQENRMREQMEKNLQQEYNNAYYQYLRSLGYRIKEGWTWRKTKDVLMVLLIMSVIFTILWFLPPTHNMLVEFYEENIFIKIVVNVVVSIVRVIFGTIANLFSSIFSGGK